MFRYLCRPLARGRLATVRRALCQPPPPADPPADAEAQLTALLRARFPEASELQVEDISGGCGAMYAVHVTAAEFAGLNRVKQHRAVQEALAAQIRDMHGIRVSTAVPSSDQS